jgi:hypothetical protein
MKLVTFINKNYITGLQQSRSIVQRTAIALTSEIGAGGGRWIVAIMVPVFLLFLACCDVRPVLLL